MLRILVSYREKRGALRLFGVRATFIQRAKGAKLQAQKPAWTPVFEQNSNAIRRRRMARDPRFRKPDPPLRGKAKHVAVRGKALGNKRGVLRLFGVRATFIQRAKGAKLQRHSPQANGDEA
jgi:hypothetical protein